MEGVHRNQVSFARHALRVARLLARAVLGPRVVLREGRERGGGAQTWAVPWTLGVRRYGRAPRGSFSPEGSYTGPLSPGSSPSPDLAPDTLQVAVTLATFSREEIPPTRRQEGQDTLTKLFLLLLPHNWDGIQGSLSHMVGQRKSGSPERVSVPAVHANKSNQ